MFHEFHTRKRRNAYFIVPAKKDSSRDGCYVTCQQRRVLLHDEKETSEREIQWRREKEIPPSKSCRWRGRGRTVEDGSDSGGSFLLFNLINEVVGLARRVQCRLPGTQCNGGDILFRVNSMPETPSASPGNRRV